MGKYFLILLIGIFCVAAYRIKSTWGIAPKRPAVEQKQPSERPEQEKPAPPLPSRNDPELYAILGTGPDWVQIEGHGILSKGDRLGDLILLAWTRKTLLVKDSAARTRELYAENPHARLAEWHKEILESNKVKTVSVLSSALPSISSQEIDSTK